MIESLAHAPQLPYHKRKLVLIFAAMRSFADDLRLAGWTVDYYRERESYEAPLAEHVARYRPERLRTMRQSEYGVDAGLRALVDAHGCELQITEHANFISTAGDFERLYHQHDGTSGVEPT